MVLMKLLKSNHFPEFYEYLLEETFTDATVSVLESSGVKRSIRCHKLVLYLAFPLIRDLITNDSDVNSELHINVPGASFYQLENLINFIYKGESKFKSFQEYEDFEKLLSGFGMDRCSITLTMIGVSTIENCFSLDWVSISDLLELKEEKETINDLVSSTPSYSCDFCGESFRTKYKLKFHVGSIHRSDHKCSECGKGFSGKYYLNQHIQRFHSNSRDFICSVCGASFSVKMDLSTHSKIHSDKKDHSCEFCHKSYSSIRALKEHSRTHTGERPYECRECHKKFALKKTLRVHFRQHSGEKPYLCSGCGKSFVQISTLKNHLKNCQV